MDLWHWSEHFVYHLDLIIQWHLQENQMNKALVSLKKGKCFDQVWILASRKNILYLNYYGNNEFGHLVLSDRERAIMDSLKKSNKTVKQLEKQIKGV